MNQHVGLCTKADGVPIVVKLAKTTDEATMVSAGRFICLVGYKIVKPSIRPIYSQGFQEE